MTDEEAHSAIKTRYADSGRLRAAPANDKWGRLAACGGLAIRPAQNWPSTTRPQAASLPHNYVKTKFKRSGDLSKAVKGYNVPL